MNGRSVIKMMTHECDTDLWCFVNTGQQYENIKDYIINGLIPKAVFQFDVPRSNNSRNV